jgi:hypothetical protein
MAPRPGPPLPGDFFPSNIDLLDMLVGADANVNVPSPGINQLLAYRFGQNGGLLATLPGSGNFDPTKIPDNPPDNTTAYDDFGNYRFDLLVVPYLEASWNGIGRRPRNPGAWSPGDVTNIVTPSGSPVPFAAISLGEAMTLSRQFVIADPTARSAVLARSLPQSLYQNSPMQPYSASPAMPVQWFNQNFGFLASRYWATDPAKSTTPIRSVLTTENGVSNFFPSKFRDMGMMPDTWPISPASLPQFLFGDSILWRGHRYVCINPLAARSAVVGTSPVDRVDPIFRANRPAWEMDNDVWVYQPWTTNPVKTSVNTATFGQLLLAYWSVMAEQYRPTDHDWAPGFPTPLIPGGPIPPTPTPTAPSPRMFRNPIRVVPTAPGPGTWQLSPVQVMQLRAALAAVNTIDMRDGDDDVTARTVHLTDFDRVTQPNLAMQDVTATVYGLERQPYITKVYATNEPVTEANSSVTQPGFVAVELYNPDPTRAYSLAGYALATINRPSAVQSSTPPDCVPTWVSWGGDMPWPPQGGQPLIPANQSIIIASNQTPPAGSHLKWPSAAPVYVVHNLVPPGAAGVAQTSELMLFRPRYLERNNPVANGVPTCSAYGMSNPLSLTPLPNPLGPSLLTTPPLHQPYPAYHEGQIVSNSYTPNPADMVPLDSYDFSGLPAFVSGQPAVEWYYVRPNDPATKSWHFVFPGHYVISASPSDVNTPRLVDGTSTAAEAITAMATSPMGATAASVRSDYQDIPLQLNNVDFAGPGIQRFSATGPSAVAFPYGQFARNGDILEAPFIGSYRLEIPWGAPGAVNVIEMNPVTMDSAMALGLSQGSSFNEPIETQFAGAHVHNGLADPLMVGTSATENVGRFCPLDLLDFGILPGNPPPTNPPFPPNDFLPANPGTVPPQWLYHFATRLFDYLTVQSPQQDYTPEADPADGDFYAQTDGSQAHNYEKYSPNDVVNPPVPVPNASGGPFGTGVFNAEPSNPNNATEETVPTPGLINLNTAPWRVLAAVPWVGPDFPQFNGSATGNRLATNVNIGLSIAYYRDINDGSGHPHGPFKSIFELNNVWIYPEVSSAGFATKTLFRDLLKSGPVPYGPNQGNITPGYPAGGIKDMVIGDFKTKFTMMNRVSNLVTTRSDSFTAYILLQGWRNAETPDATLAVQRRAALLIDRSGVTPVNPSPAVTFVPNQ